MLCFQFKGWGPGKDYINPVTWYCWQHTRPGHTNLWVSGGFGVEWVGEGGLLWASLTMADGSPQCPAGCCATLREATSSRRGAKLILQLSVCATCACKRWNWSWSWSQRMILSVKSLLMNQPTSWLNILTFKDQKCLVFLTFIKCACHLMNPCSFCSVLTSWDTNIFVN